MKTMRKLMESIEKNQGKRVTFSAARYQQQVIEAERIMRESHERLLAEGWTWDGMDGYSKEEKRS